MFSYKNSTAKIKAVTFVLFCPAGLSVTQLGGMEEKTNGLTLAEKLKSRDEMYTVRQEIEEEESKLVAGIKPLQETRGGTQEAGEEIADQKNVEGQEVENIKNATHSKFAERELPLQTNLTQSRHKPKTAKLKENNVNENKVKQSKVSPQPQLTEPSDKMMPTTKTPSAKQTKINTSSGNKKMIKAQEKKRKKDNRTTPTYFPYFMDDYCPPECACYGR